MTAAIAAAMAVAWALVSCVRVARRQAAGAAAGARTAPVRGLFDRLQDVERVGAGEVYGETGSGTVAPQPSLRALVREHSTRVRWPGVLALAGPALVVAIALAPPSTPPRAVAWYAIVFAPGWVAGFAYWTREEGIGAARAIVLGHAFVLYSLHWVPAAWVAIAGRGVSAR